jgi:multicomponent Na+:H+ antiporter subunit E
MPAERSFGVRSVSHDAPVSQTAETAVGDHCKERMKKKQRSGRVLVLTAFLSGIWYLLSGMFDPLHLGTGVVAAFVISLNLAPVADRTTFHPARFFLFVPWLIGQVVISNLRVARVVLSRRATISPGFVAQAPGVTGPRALTALGSSITLTPGTLTIDIDDDEIFVHALDTASAQDVRDGVMARRVREFFLVDGGR